jgi:hypothetical protein
MRPDSVPSPPSLSPPGGRRTPRAHSSSPTKSASGHSVPFIDDDTSLATSSTMTTSAHPDLNPISLSVDRAILRPPAPAPRRRQRPPPLLNDMSQSMFVPHDETDIARFHWLGAHKCVCILI